MRLWRWDGRALRIAAGPDPGQAPAPPRTAGLTPTPWGTVWLEPVSEVEGFWLELSGVSEVELSAAAERLLPLVGALLDAERQRAFLAEELTSRYEEIDLLYAISEMLGQTVRLVGGHADHRARGEHRGWAAARVSHDHGVRQGRRRAHHRGGAGFGLDGRVPVAEIG